MRHATPDLIFDAEDLERHHGSLDLYWDEADDYARAREDRLSDHAPPNASTWMTPPTHRTPDDEAHRSSDAPRFGDHRLPPHFWDKVTVADNDCWEWTGMTSVTGYGMATFANRPYRAHRASYEVLVGVILPWFVLHHRCENKLCVNPSHLESLTPRAHRLVHADTRQVPTECRKGHPLTEDNVRIERNGRRRCRACERERRKPFAPRPADAPRHLYVAWRGDGTWQARVTVDGGQRVTLGNFTDPADAARAVQEFLGVQAQREAGTTTWGD